MASMNFDLKYAEHCSAYEDAAPYENVSRVRGQPTVLCGLYFVGLEKYQSTAVHGKEELYAFTIAESHHSDVTRSRTSRYLWLSRKPLRQSKWRWGL